MTELQVGRLRVTIPDGGPTCGIHGLSTVSGRCQACDGDGSIEHRHMGRTWPKADLGRGPECAYEQCIDPQPERRS